MAQWMGQSTGRTSWAKIQVAADSLTHALAVWHTIGPGPDRDKKAKAVHRLANRLFALRTQWRKSQTEATIEALTRLTLAQREVEIERLRREDAELRAGGLTAIFEEFAIPRPLWASGSPDSK